MAISPKNHVDFNVIHLYTENDVEFEKVFVALAIDSVADAFKNISQAIEEQNLINTRACGHKLKGASSIAGLITLNKLAYTLNEMVSIDPDNLQNLQVELQEEVKLVTQILQEYLESF